LLSPPSSILSSAYPDQAGLELGDHGQPLKSSRPTGSVGSWTDQPRLSFTFRLVGLSRATTRADKAVGQRTVGQPPISIELFMFAP